MPRVVLKIGGDVPAAAAAAAADAATGLAAADANATDATLKCLCDDATDAVCAFHLVERGATVLGTLSKDTPFLVERNMLCYLDDNGNIHRRYHLCSFCEDDDKSKEPIYAAYCHARHDESGKPHKHSAFMMCEGCDVSLCPKHAVDGCLCDVGAKSKKKKEDEEEDDDEEEEEKDEEEEDEAGEPASKRAKH